MAFKKVINGSFWTLPFHLIASLFYICMLSTFMSARNAILTGRMITTWYLVFHMGFIFLRLIQDFINLTPAKDGKFNETFAKFNNLVFISLIFPFALYIPLVYWLLFYYDSNLMLPNFVEISLPSWVSTSSHSVTALVALLEMMTTKYIYDGNHISSLIIMSMFSMGYITCLVGTYVQYGFWLYPIFHLTPPNYLPFVFSSLLALLLVMYIIGKFIAEHLLADKDDGEFPDKQDAKKPLTTSNSNATLSIENNDIIFLDSQPKEDQRSTSSSAGLKRILKKTLLFPFRSKVQKPTINEKKSYEISNTEVRNLSQYPKRGDEIESMSSFIETKDANPVKSNDALKIKEDKTAGVKRKRDAKDDNSIEKTSSGDKKSGAIFENISTSRNDDVQMSKLNLSKENDGIQILNSQVNKENNEPSVGSVEYAVVNPQKDQPSNINNADHHYADVKDGQINPSNTNYTKIDPPFVKPVTDNKSFNNENTRSNDANAASNTISHEDEPKYGKTHSGSSFRFRLQLFSNNNSSETLSLKKRHETKENSNDKISVQQKANSQTKEDNHLPIQKITDPKQENSVTQTGIDLRKGIQTTDQKLDEVQLSTSDCEKSSSRTSTPRSLFGKQKRNKFAKFFESNKLASKIRMANHARGTISRNSPVSEESEGQKKTPRNTNYDSDTSSVKQYELQTVESDQADVNNYCGICGVKKPKELQTSQFSQKSKKNEPSTSKAVDSVVESSCKKERSKIDKRRKCDKNDITSRRQCKQVAFQSKSTITCYLCNSKQEENRKRNPPLKKNTKNEIFVGESENDDTKTVEYAVVKSHKMKGVKKEKRKEQKYERPCHSEEELLVQNKKQKDGIDDISDHKKIRKYKKRDKKNDFPENFSTLAEKERQNRHIPRTCEELLNEKAFQRRSEKSKKPRYEILPKLKANLKKMNVSTYSRTSDKECKCKGKEPIENTTKAKKLIHDVPTSSTKTNPVSGRTKKKIVGELFKLSKHAQKDEKKKLVEILKKCANGSKIEAFLATVPAKDKRQLNIDFDNADELQNFQASLFSDHAQLYKFCIVFDHSKHQK